MKVETTERKEVRSEYAAFFLKLLIWVCLGALIGALAWIPLGLDAPLVTLWCLPFAWLFVPNKRAAFALVFGYYLITGREGGQIIHRFGEMTEWQGIGIIVACSALVALLWTVAWHRKPIWRIAGLCGVLVVTSLPPLGGFIYGSALLSAGWLYPGMGFIGIGFLVISWVSVFAFLEFRKAQIQTAKNIAAVSALVCVGASLVLNAQYVQPTNQDVYAVNTQLSRFPKPLEAQYQRQEQLLQTAQDALKLPYPIVLMPEELGGLWQPRFAWLWEDLGKTYSEYNKTLIMGFDTQPEQVKNKLANTGKLLGVTPQNKQTDVLARVSAPIGAWRPWDNKLHAPARWTSPAHIHLQGRNYVLIFCWEELVPWPWFASAASLAGNRQLAPTALIMVNNWFGKDLSINEVQAKSSQSWARLFGWGYVRAVNVSLP